MEKQQVKQTIGMTAAVFATAGALYGIHSCAEAPKPADQPPLPVRQGPSAPEADELPTDKESSKVIADLRAQIAVFEKRQAEYEAQLAKGNEPHQNSMPAPSPTVEAPKRTNEAASENSALEKEIGLLLEKAIPGNAVTDIKLRELMMEPLRVVFNKEVTPFTQDDNPNKGPYDHYQALLGTAETLHQLDQLSKLDPQIYPKALSAAKYILQELPIDKKLALLPAINQLLPLFETATKIYPQYAAIIETHEEWRRKCAEILDPVAEGEGEDEYIEPDKKTQNECESNAAQLGYLDPTSFKLELSERGTNVTEEEAEMLKAMMRVLARLNKSGNPELYANLPALVRSAFAEDKQEE